MAPVFDSCAVVPGHLTVEQAHNILRIHNTCPADQCLRRKAALFFLMESRRADRGVVGPRLPGSTPRARGLR
ncbi:hypothetical protein [Nocardia macrotermitis]|uniref:Uncharacterized protein n=1 Tax=Nocardia macrotermitis TaxID=2585198 RepID=A0A7K0D116_9NOCA|nr:hypothetical protein [Nocardia macrotermitis]MQY19413.1 hypothetical protein [Nocardia macrotermitis]